MTTKTPSKNGKFLGRPSKYDPALCDQVVELGRLGLSRYQICSRLDIGWRNLQNWEGAHDDFRAALEESRIHALNHWEQLAQTYLIETPGSAKLNTGLWSRSMSARFPREYRENTKHEIVGKDDGAVQVDVVHDFSQALLNDLLSLRQDDAESGTN